LVTARRAHLCAWRALQRHLNTGKTRYAGNASLGRCHGAGVKLSIGFIRAHPTER
jgi:hypothetical protein